MTNQRLQQKGTTLHVVVQPNDYDPAGVELVRSLLGGTSLLLPGSAQVNEDGTLSLAYEIPAGFSPLPAYAKHANLTERLNAAMQLLRLADGQAQQVILDLQPDNVFLTGMDLRVGHRGIEGVLAPATVDAADYFQRLKALVIVCLRPGLDFASVIAGAKASDNALTKQLAAAKDVAGLRAVLAEAATEATQGKTVVSQVRYRTFKWLAIAGAVLVLGLAGGMVYELGFAAPHQARVVKALGDYAGGNYSGATEALRQDNPKQLDAATQYALAVSYIKQDNLNAKQQRILTAGLSPKTTTNTLLYWIELGRGQLKSALNLAKNVGDNQLILYAYGKLYDATEADNSLPGAKKQKLLKEYDAAVKAYTKKVGGN